MNDTPDGTSSAPSPEEPSSSRQSIEVVARISRQFQELRLDETTAIEPAFLDPILGLGDIGNLSGLPGCGKTTIAADLLLAAGHPEREGFALGRLLRFDLDLLGSGSIAIIDGENSISRWKSLLRRKAELEDLDPTLINRKIIYVRSSDCGLYDPNHRREKSRCLAEALAQRGVRFVIGDTLAMIWAPSDINASGWVQDGFVPFRSACQEFRISGLMLTHIRRPMGKNDLKASGPIGSSFQEGQADAQIMIERTSVHGRPALRLTIQKTRRAYWIQSGASATVVLSPTLGYEPIGDWQTSWPHSPTDYICDCDESLAIGKIRAILSAEPNREFSSSDLADLSKLSARHVRNLLKDLFDRGQVLRTGNGPSTRWRCSQ